jgi:tetratricopeptide (TPR) repeat protein
MTCHAMGAESAPTAPEKLPSPLHMTGIGNGHIAITTSNPEAQVWFDQGLNLQHDFWDYESAKAFEQAVRLDPNCAMCWWGLAQAMDSRGKDTDVFVEDAFEHAKKLKAHGTSAEKLYIEASLASKKDEKKESRRKSDPAVHHDSAETRKLRKLVALYPASDQASIQARIFLAGSLHDGFTHGEPNAGTAEAQRILAQLILEHPDDTASLHYWIHVIEPGNHPELARDAAVRLGGLVPTSGHMVHMPGHIFYLLGDYNRAQVSFAASTAVDEAYMRAQNVSPDDDWNYVHNLMYSIADLLEAGRFAEADALALKTTTAHGTRPTTLYVGSPRDGISRLDAALPAALRSANWNMAKTLLEKSTAPATFPNLGILREGLLQYAKGMQALESKDMATAKSASAEMERVVKTSVADKTDHHAMPGMKKDPRDAMLSPIHSYLSIAALELSGGVAMVDGRTADADRDFKQAVETEAALSYREPPTYLRPAAETEADALMRAGRFDDARKALELVVKKRPESGFALYGIARVDEATGSADTGAAYEKFLRAWSKADSELPQVVHARAWIEKHAAGI